MIIPDNCNLNNIVPAPGYRAERKMNMNATTNRERICITIGEVSKHVSTWSLGVVASRMDTVKGDAVFYYFDEVILDQDSLIFRRKNCYDRVGFKLEEITDDVYLEMQSDGRERICFSLTNGEIWHTSQLCARDANPEKLTEIEAYEILNKLDKASIVRIRHSHPSLRCESYYSTHEYINTDEIHDDWGGDGEIMVVFGDIRNHDVSCSIDLDDNLPHYLVDVIRCCNVCEDIRISLRDAAFTEVTLTIFCPECAEEVRQGNRLL